MGDQDDYEELSLDKSESDPKNETVPLLETEDSDWVEIDSPKKKLRYMRVPNRIIDLM
jgi:hypothetical protein